jgi:branched-chain amino acid transport system ATP-binding protein
MSLLEVERLTRRFGGLAAVAEVSFAVEEGEIVGLIGPNGAGKTTLFAVLAGALPPSSGRIRFDGRDVTGWASDKAARAGVGRTYQIVRMFRSMTTFENVLVSAYLRNASPRAARKRALTVLERVGLLPVADEPAVNLPLALKRRLELARALATTPRLLLLDEVMSGLTPVEETQAVELVRSLNAEGLTIILVEHVMEVVMPLSARVVVLDHGAKIAEGAPAAVSRDTAVIEAYLGEPLEDNPPAGNGGG